MATSFFNIHSAGPVRAGSPEKGERLGTVQAESAREALDAYSIGRGFVSYADAEIETTEWPDGSCSAPFTNFEIIAVPSFVNLDAVRAMSDQELLRSLREDAMPAELYQELARERQARGLFCSCEWEETGGPESGPSVSLVERKEDCPEHGRAADPEGWAQADKEEEQFTIALIGSALLAAGAPDSSLLNGREGEALAHFEERVDAYGDDEHAAEKAASDVAATLRIGAEPSVKAPEEPRSCRFCGGEVQSRNPDTDFCRNCYYGGRPYEEQHAALLEAFRSLAGVKRASVWHTGGGCFNLAVTFDDGRLATPSVSFREPDGSWGIEPGFPSDHGDRWGVVVSESEEAWSEWDEERLAMPQEALGLTEVELVGYVAKLAAQPGVLEPAPGKARTILAHLNIQVPASDPRTADHIAADIESALRVGLEGAPADVMVERYFWTLVEEVS